jgi:hypothetical protein
MRWYRKISSGSGDFEALAEALDWFMTEYENMRPNLKLSGRIEKTAQMVPGWVEYNWGCLQEIDAIEKWVALKADIAMDKARKYYLEGHNKLYTPTVAEKMAAGSEDVVAMRLLHLEVHLVREKFVSMSKGLEILHYQIGHITKLHAAGVEDAVFYD